MGEMTRALSAVPVVLDEAARGRLERLAASVTAQVRQVLRAKIVLAAATGSSNGRIARELALSVNTVRKWRGRFASDGLDGLRDARRSGRPRTYGPDVRVAVVATATFTAFLERLDALLPRDKEIHVVLDIWTYDGAPLKTA